MMSLLEITNSYGTLLRVNMKNHQQHRKNVDSVSCSANFLLFSWKKSEKIAESHSRIGTLKPEHQV